MLLRMFWLQYTQAVILIRSKYLLFLVAYMYSPKSKILRTQLWMFLKGKILCKVYCFNCLPLGIVWNQLEEIKLMLDENMPSLFHNLSMTRIGLGNSPPPPTCSTHSILSPQEFLESLTPWPDFFLGGGGGRALPWFTSAPHKVSLCLTIQYWVLYVSFIHNPPVLPLCVKQGSPHSRWLPYHYI